MSPAVMLSNSICPLTADEGLKVPLYALEVVVFSSATLVYVVSKAKISRNIRQLPAEALTRINRTPDKRFAMDVCRGSVGLGVGAAVSGAK